MEASGKDSSATYLDCSKCQLLMNSCSRYTRIFFFDQLLRKEHPETLTSIVADSLRTLVIMLKPMQPPRAMLRFYVLPKSASQLFHALMYYSATTRVTKTTGSGTHASIARNIVAVLASYGKTILHNTSAITITSERMLQKRYLGAAHASIKIVLRTAKEPTSQMAA
jgi:hypothetical protein